MHKNKSKTFYSVKIGMGGMQIFKFQIFKLQVLRAPCIVTQLRMTTRKFFIGTRNILYRYI